MTWAKVGMPLSALRQVFLARDLKAHGVPTARETLDFLTAENEILRARIKVLEAKAPKLVAKPEIPNVFRAATRAPVVMSSETIDRRRAEIQARLIELEFERERHWARALVGDP